MQIKKVKSICGELDQCTYKSCMAEIGIGDDFATIYHIESSDKNKGHATELITMMREHYQTQGKAFATTVALSPQMRHLVKKLNLREYK